MMGPKRMAMVALPVLIGLAWSCACAGEVVLDLDFSHVGAERKVMAKGRFAGVLPTGLNENFTGWCDAKVTSAAREEDGRRFMTFSTSSGAEAQFGTPDFEICEPGVYKLTVLGRTRGASTVTCVARLGAPTWKAFLSHGFTAEDWKEESVYFEFPKGEKGSLGFFVLTSPGRADIQRITLERSTHEAFARSMRRPSEQIVNYLRHSRFPLGLPTGWSMGRECVGHVFGADAADAPDGIPTLRIVGERPFSLCSEPFQTAFPGERHVVRFRYKADRPMTVCLLDAKRQSCGNRRFDASTVWREGTLSFIPPLLSEAFCLEFSCEGGMLKIDRAYSGKEDRSPGVKTPEVALLPTEGEIAAETRIQFDDEAALVSWAVCNASAGARLRFRIADMYGEEKALDPVVLSGGTLETGCLRYDVFPNRPYGQFRIQAIVEVEGTRMSPIEESVVTRLPRPKYWGRDAPDSSFGCHFNPWRPMVKTMKAAGINWARLHDAGELTTHWAALEPEKGKWRFRDDEVQAYRDEHIKIFAQLGTAPKWATRYEELGLRDFGYFERYLRPTNVVDWVNYVTTVVRRYDGTIDEYFFWNEPWSRWWRDAADAKLYDAARYEEDFMSLLKVTCAAVKNVNPKIRFCGLNGTGGEFGRKWLETALREDAVRMCDAVDWHFYSSKSLAHRKDPNSLREAFSPLWSDKSGQYVKPVYMTEGQGSNDGGSARAGHGGGLYKVTVPWTPDSRDAYVKLADATVRFHVALLAQGNKRLFVYTAHAYQGLGARADFQVYVGADGYPQPGLVANAQLARAIEDKDFVRKEDFGQRGLRYVFANKTDVVSVYSDLSAAEMVALTRTAKCRTAVRDLFGNPVCPERVLPETLVYVDE